MKININSTAKKAEEEAKRKAEEAEKNRIAEEERQRQAEEEKQRLAEEMKRKLEAQVRAEAADKERREELRRQAREKARLDREEELRAIEEAEARRKEEKEQEKHINKKRKRDKTKIIERANPETNDDFYRNYQARIRNNRLKKAIFNVAFYFTIIFLIGINIYLAFFHQLRPIQEIAKDVRTINQDSKYPKEGVELYLAKNIKTILNNDIKASTGTGTKEWEIRNLYVRKIVTRGDRNANVYFTAEIATNMGASFHNFILPLGYNFDTRRYYPTGNLITRAEQDDDYTDIYKEGSLWEFGKAKKMPTDQTEKLQSFLNSFFTLVYNEHKSVSSMLAQGYEPKVGDINFRFEKINKLEWYNEANPMGANVYVNYTLSSTEGLSYTVDTYMIIQNSNNIFLISKIY